MKIQLHFDYETAETFTLASMREQNADAPEIMAALDRFEAGLDCHDVVSHGQSTLRMTAVYDTEEEALAIAEKSSTSYVVEIVGGWTVAYNVEQACELAVIGRNASLEQCNSVVAHVHGLTGEFGEVLAGGIPVVRWNEAA